MIGNESLPLEKPPRPFPKEEPVGLPDTRESPGTLRSQAAGRNHSLVLALQGGDKCRARGVAAEETQLSLGEDLVVTIW